MSKLTTDLKILRAPNQKVEPHEAKHFINLLEQELKLHKYGVGLALPQISINKRACIIRYENDGLNINLDLINPEIVEMYDPFINENEMCLSLPNIKVNTRRYKEIVVKDDLHPAGLVLIGIASIISQHEIDHTQSILITDRAVGKNSVGRNDPCPCGKKENNKPVKFKRCHGKEI